MKSINRILAALAIAILVVTLYLLSWLRSQSASELENSVTHAVAMFKVEDVLHGPGGDTLVRFDRVEQLAELARQSPYIKNVVVTRLLPNGQEIPIVPFTLLARRGPDWPKELAGWDKQPLGKPGETFGNLYLDLDRSTLRSIHWAIGGIGLTIALMLVTLLARLWSQETSLTKTVVELDQRRRELIRVERLALAGQLAAGLLHDLRKPVLQIQHNLDDITEALGDFAPAAISLQELRRHTRLFFQMLSESQIERFVQSDRVAEEYVDIIPIIDASLALIRYERRGVEVIRREEDNLPSVMAQPFRLVQLFSNLILNAYQAMKGKGRITVEAKPHQGGVEIRFIDNGPGMPADVMERVFDPFYTTKPEGEGTGLGLSICRMIVDDMNGVISVESRAGGPTAFIVWLPQEHQG